MKKNNINEELHSAIRTGQYEMVVRLVNEGADINYKDTSKNDALFYAVVHCKNDIVKYLIQKGANLNTLYKDNQNILHVAVITECEDKGAFMIVEVLVHSGVEINLQDKYGNTSLWYACIYHAINLNTINYLLESGANMNLKNKYGVNTYTSAKENNEYELLKMLERYQNIKQ
jgi:ankyrin repeat protein